MGRGKLPLRLIPKERARRITFAKRKKGLVKKAYELSTLCDVKVCVIIYDAANQLSDDHHYHHQHDHHRGHHHQQVVHQPIQYYTWPEQPREVESIIAKYLAYKAKNPVSKKDLDISDFFKEKIKKLQHDTKKLAEENKIKKIMMLKSGSTDHHHDHDHDYDQFDLLWDKRINGFSLTQLLDLMTHLDNRISDANNHWTDRYNSNMMVMCMTPHDKYYYDIDHHGHHNNYQFGSTSMSPMMGNTSSEYHDNYNSNQLLLFPQCDHYYDPQYFWSHDQPASSSKTVQFDHHSSFTSMMLSSHFPTDYNEDTDNQYYSNLLNIGTTMFNNNDTSVGELTNAMSTDHDHVGLHRQEGVFLNNHADVAMQTYGMPLFGGSVADGSGYSPAGNQFHADSSQQDVRFCNNQPHGFGRV